MSAAPTRRGWLKRLGALLGGSLLAGPALAHAASRSPHQQLGNMPYIGEIMLCAFNFAPKGFALCNGQELPIAQNQALFSLLGIAYGGNGQTTFGLPDLRGRVLRGISASGAYSLGAINYYENQPINASSLLAHTHSDNVSSTMGSTNSPAQAVPAVVASTNLNGEAVAVLAYGTAPAATTPTTTSAGYGSNITVPTVAPYLALNYCIALTGLYPPRS